MRHGSHDIQEDIAVSLEERQDGISLSVENAGPGFPPDFRPEATETLGYRMIRALLQRHAGTLVCGYRKDGLGARVELRLHSPSLGDKEA